MLEYLRQLLFERGLAPHGYCLLWSPALIWTHVVSDAAIGIAYFSIPVVIAVFLTRRRDVEFSWVVWMFAVFIMACGATHFMSILVLWVPAYGWEALLKLFTAAASVVTAAALWPLLPRAIAVPSPTLLRRVNDDLTVRIGERDAALAALEQATAERERSEAMLRQAQKMEAVGQLTGGIAHDFNNLLTIIVANLDRAQRLAGSDERLGKCLDAAVNGADRAAVLVDQLLAFARNQPLDPAEQDLNAIVRSAGELIGHSLGSQIELELELEDGLPPVAIDRNQAENAILNLAINARDAMTDGGRLVLATSRVGTSVALTVADTGCGMGNDVATRAFEPFYTTKPVGAGSGLGLSQVYGFARQSGGDVTIDSIPGEGTRITLTFLAGAEHADG